MSVRPLWLFIVLPLLAFPPAEAGAATCDSLAGLTLANTTITAAVAVAPGAFVLPPGGREQGLMETQRYPADYDGIMAGAPAVTFGFNTFVSGKREAFRDRGGKLVIYHGGSDAPQPTVNYQQLVSRMGQKDVDGFLQVYVVPGMGHCGSGSEPNDFG